MQQLLYFFEGIGKAIVGIFNFIVSFFGDVVYIVQLTGNFFLQLPSYFSWLPGELVAILLIAFAVVVIYKVVGREG